MKRLDIYYGDRPVAELGLTASGQYVLTYHKSWVKSGFGVSVNLPLSASEYEGELVRCFFENLLPEGRIREELARRFGVDRENTYALLERVGRDCAGAFSIGNGGQRGFYTALTPEETERLLPPLAPDSVREFPIGSTLSLAGAQDKMVLFRKDGCFYLPQEGVASNCIIKTPILGLQHSVHNEYLCMQLAADAGLPVAETETVRLPQTEVLLIKRFDRRGEDFHPQRIPQEDFCQMSGLSSACKYERDGGPGFGACAELIRRYSCRSASDLLLLVRWAAFNLCIGNNDAHAKNISMLREKRSYCLAPFYDLISTTYYGRRLSRRLAMCIGGKNRSFWISGGRWARFADDIKLPVQTVLRLVRSTAEDVLRVLPQTAERVPSEATQSLVLHIRRRCEGVLEHLES